jgi:TrpR-related protein YerC/YecD
MKRRFTEAMWRKDPTFRRLCEAFLRCKTLDEVADFLRDIATLSEMKAMSERLDAAQLLAKGISYREVADTVKASTTTVSRVAWFLRNGEGYKNVLKNVGHHHHSPSLAGRGRGRS